MARMNNNILPGEKQQETLFEPYQYLLFAVKKSTSYEERQQARKLRYERQAAAAREQAIKDSDEGVSMLKVLPPGQPILVGHHSESKHRNLLERSDNRMRKSIENDEKATYYESKAYSVGKGGVSSDDPQAIEKIEQKIKNLEETHKRMKAANIILRKNPHDKDGILALGFSEDICSDIMKPSVFGKYGFESFQLTGKRAEIKRLQQRLNGLKKRSQGEASEVRIQDYVYRHDPKENRVMFIFDGKPDEKTRSVLKSHSFKWSPRRGAWVRQATGNAFYAAKKVRKELSLLTA